MEGLLNLCSCSNFLFLLRLKHALDTVSNLIDGIVDDGVETDFDTLFLCEVSCISRRTYLETDDDRIGCSSQHDIGLGDCAH